MDHMVDLMSAIKLNTCPGGLSTFQRTCIVGIGFIIQISCFLFRNWGIRIKGQRTVRQGQKAMLEGIVQFNKSIKYIKWQKYRNGEYVDINIHLSKYKGTTTSLQNPVLQIHEFDADDDVFYRLAVVMVHATKFSEHRKIILLPINEDLTVKIYSDQNDGIYYFGEDVTIKTKSRNPLAILCATWQRERENEIYTIDTSLPKYTGKRDESNEYQLMIKNCDESDIGTYFLLLVCTDGLEMHSNRIDLKILRASPTVILNRTSEAIYDQPFSFTAIIRSFPKHVRVIWMKGNKHIDITQPKYNGSSDVGYRPVLCINNVRKKDEDVYKIKVRNGIGDDACCAEELIIMKEKPEVCLEMSGQSKKVPYGTAFTLRADVKSYPAPDIRWTREKDGCIEDINQKDGKFVVNNSNKNSPNLTVENFDFNDNGNYFITVSNEIDSVSDSVQLNVEVVQIKPTTIVSEGDTAHLKGMIKFHHSIRYVKWQICLNEKFVDIDVHKPKYLGTLNVLQHPELVINDVDADDQVEYRLEVQMTKSKEYSNVETVKINRSKEIPTIEISTDQLSGQYYVGEYVKIKARIRNPNAVLCLTWQKVAKNGSHTIDTTMEKYSGTICETDEHTLVIRNCNNLDSGTYFLLAACTSDMGTVISNKINLDIFQGPPTVTLSYVHETLYNECIELKATVRSFPTHTSVIWKKGSEKIDIKLPKYRGSSEGGNFPILHINNATGEDEDFYTVEVYNKLGKGTRSSEKLKVIGEIPEVDLMISKQSQSVTYGNTINLEATIISLPAPVSIQWGKDGNPIQPDSIKFVTDRLDDGTHKLSIRYLELNDSGKYSVLVTNALGSTYKEIDIVVKGDTIIFIAGPVVVSPSDTIWFRTIFPTNIQIADEKWFITKKDITRRINSTDKGVSLKLSQSQPVFQTLEIKPAVEYGGTFHLSVESSDGTLKSNKINVFVDDSGKFATETEGNCLRFFALQAISRDAMEKALDSMPGTFQSKLQTYVNMCISKKRNTNLPTPPPSTLRDLDISQMYSIFRNGINIIPPRKGWGNFPDVNDTNMADDIERLRQYRNKISHENSSEMTTVDFNESVLDLIRAIRRLTSDDEHLMKQISDILNKVFCKGREMDSMMEKLKELRGLVSKDEDLLKEDQTNISMENDTQAIQLTGDTQLNEGKKAKFSAFIKPTVSNLSKVFWQRIDPEGNIYTIDLNDGKYFGSTITLPSPQLYVYFVRTEDEGTYRIVVDTYRKVIENSIQLKVKKREYYNTQNDAENRDSSEEIGFHEVHNPGIHLLNDGKIAWTMLDYLHSGVCFTNRPLNVGEKIYIRIVQTTECGGCLDFGVTNKNPFSINDPSFTSIYKKGSILRDDKSEKSHEQLNIDDVCSLCINNNASIVIAINKRSTYTRSLKNVSIKKPMWLAFDLWGSTQAIEISKKEPKRGPIGPYFTDEIFS